MSNEYRITKDTYLGYEVQIRRWWFPIWLEVNGANTHSTIRKAEGFAIRHADKRPVKLLGKLPPKW